MPIIENNLRQEPNQNCPCIIRLGPDAGIQAFNQTWFDFQQTWITDILNTVTPPDGVCVPVGREFPSDLVLRILPLGASIVYGVDSTDGNGFREDLRQKLVANGASVNMVGELQSGTMIDNDVSGFSGFRIDQVAPLMEHALPWRPNLIIIHVGEFLRSFISSERSVYSRCPCDILILKTESNVSQVTHSLNREETIHTALPFLKV